MVIAAPAAIRLEMLNKAKADDHVSLIFPDPVDGAVGLTEPEEEESESRSFIKQSLLEAKSMVMRYGWS